jgi:hypothetical protein
VESSQLSVPFTLFRIRLYEPEYLGYRLDWGIVPARGTDFAVCHYACRPAVRATWSPFKWLPVAVSSEVKQAEYKADL